MEWQALLGNIQNAPRRKTPLSCASLQQYSSKFSMAPTEFLVARCLDDH
jgi:hypothetical protein